MLRRESAVAVAWCNKNGRLLAPRFSGT